MRECPRHTFLLLTKWPERLAGVRFPENVWVGVSVTNQAGADRRIKALLRLHCRHRWVSVEPMLGPVDFVRWLDIRYCGDGYNRCDPQGTNAVEFVACGPETGPGARPCDPTWISDLCDQCSDAGVPFYDKREPGTGRFGNCGRDWPREWKEATSA
jgi:protein gp37